MAQLSSHNARTRHWWPSQQTETTITREQGRISERHAYLYLRLDERNTTGWLRRRRTVAGEREVFHQIPTHSKSVDPLVPSTVAARANVNFGHVRIIHVVRQLQMHERRATPPTATATMVRDRTNERGFRGAVEAALCRAALVALKPRDDTDGGHQCAGRRTSVIERRDRAAR